ncbi:MAG: 50S ribosomal protein L15 [Chitinophagales bacterium]|nr:50S ribosomal protein L15 [Chitinophagales bacterium]
MNLSSLKPAKGSIKKVKRIGRGEGSGHGGTSTRGNNGAGQRSGNKEKRGFEGGQMPLQRRLPKGGFKNLFRREYEIINLGKLQEYADKFGIADINHETLTQNHIIRKKDRVKILGNGELKTKLNVHVNAVSESAKSAIEAAGGTVNLI